MKVSKFCLLTVIFCGLGGANLSAQTTKAALMEKTVKEFYQTNYGDGEIQPITSEWLTPELDGLIYDQFGSALGRLSGVEHVSSDLDADPFIDAHEIDELKNFSAKAVSENEVRVKFELFGEKRDITLRLICDKDCLVGGVKLSDGDSLKTKIKKSLKAAHPSNYGKIFKE
nr:hypothetical protein [uncultured Campylobacter sp.]